MKNTSFILFLFSTLMALHSSYGSYFEVSFSDVDLDTSSPVSLLPDENSGVANIDTNIDKGISLKYGFDNGWSILYSKFDGNSLMTAEEVIGGVLFEEFSSQNLMLEYTIENAISEKLYWMISLGFGLAWVDYNIEAVAIVEQEIGDSSSSTKDRVSAFSAGYGIGYNLNENMDLLLHYRYSNVREIDLSGIDLPEWDMGGKSINVGLRIKF